MGRQYGCGMCTCGGRWFGEGVGVGGDGAGRRRQSGGLWLRLMGHRWNLDHSRHTTNTAAGQLIEHWWHSSIRADCHLLQKDTGERMAV